MSLDFKAATVEADKIKLAAALERGGRVEKAAARAELISRFSKIEADKQVGIALKYFQDRLARVIANGRNGLSVWAGVDEGICRDGKWYNPSEFVIGLEKAINERLKQEPNEEGWTLGVNVQDLLTKTGRYRTKTEAHGVAIELHKSDKHPDRYVTYGSALDHLSSLHQLFEEWLEKQA